MTNQNLSAIFKAYDIRGKVGSELNSTSTKNIGRAFADWLPAAGTVAVGRDMRPDSKELANAMIAGLREQGRDVWDIGEVTSDMIYFAVGHFKLAGGAMITASHNPGADNGIKLCREEAKPISEESGLLEIRDFVLEEKFKPAGVQGKIKTEEIVESWIEHVLSFVDPKKLKPLKVVVDAGNGMAGKIFAELEPYVPFDVTEMYFELDGTFPNHIANPLEPKNLVDLIARIKQEKADVGIAFDGDGDRAVLVDENGQALSGTVMTAILASYFLGKHPGATILYNAICGQAAIDAIQSGGGKAVRTRVGHSFIKSDMRKYGAVFAGEHSGHYYFQDNFMADSGLIATTIALAVVCQSGKSLSQLAGQYRTYCQINETNFEVADKKAVMQAVSQAFKSAKQDWLDGLTVNFEGGWLNVRPSNTEPLLRLNAEARTSQQLDEIVKKVTAIIKA